MTEPEPVKPWWPDDRDVREAAERNRPKQPYNDKPFWNVQPTRTEQP